MTKRAPQSSLLLLLLVLLISVTPALAEEAESVEAETPATAESTTSTPGMSLEELLTPEAQDMAGCTAEVICVHTPPLTVSCSSSVNGTCQASGGGCGQVTCNGNTTRCPGYCVGDHHCFTFCLNKYDTFDSYCDEGCCECIT